MEIIGSSWKFIIFSQVFDFFLYWIELSRKTGYAKKFASTVCGIS